MENKYYLARDELLPVISRVYEEMPTLIDGQWKSNKPALIDPFWYSNALGVEPGKCVELIIRNQDTK